ncbi:MAG TPA: flavodoxin domain-containing protein [Puia sp.]|jgi:menaquinone-dependent protoporphyrinogen IX oxidase|nr:flavodoxin domain-containing protein [Puia sp.]
MTPSTKGAIIYSSRYGATQQYAEWLAEKLKWPLLTAETTSTKDLAPFNTLVIGSSVYIGRLLIKGWLKTHNPALGDKDLSFFIVCGTPASERAQQETIARTNIPHDLIGPENVFFLPGRLLIDRLSWKDKFMLRMGARLQKDPAKKASMVRDVDGVKKEHLTPILQHVRAPLQVI